MPLGNVIFMWSFAKGLFEDLLVGYTYVSVSVKNENSKLVVFLSCSPVWNESTNTYFACIPVVPIPLSLCRDFPPFFFMVYWNGIFLRKKRGREEEWRGGGGGGGGAAAGGENANIDIWKIRGLDWQGHIIGIIEKLLRFLFHISHPSISLIISKRSELGIFAFYFCFLNKISNLKGQWTFRSKGEKFRSFRCLYTCDDDSLSQLLKRLKGVTSMYISQQVLIYFM